MGEKKSKNGGEKKKNDEQQQNKKNRSSEGSGKDDPPITVVLKVHMDCQCEGCTTRIKKCVRGYEGVESVKGDGDSNKFTVIGKVDPWKLRETVEQKAKKKVELVSPLPKKDKVTNKEDKPDKNGGGGGEKKAEGKPEKKPDDKKAKEPPVTTAVMKVNLHCQGCIQKIRRTITKAKGYHDMSIDEQKNLVTVKGTMDMKVLADTLKDKLKKSVEIVPPKKDGGEGGGGGKKEKGGGGGGGGGGEGGGGGGGGGGVEKKEKEKSGGGGGGEKGINGEGDGGGGNAGGLVEENRFQYGYPNPYADGHGHGHGHGLGYPVDHYHAPQLFSDENPNACAIM